ncbi:MAG: hypothetical protein ED557_05655 [Balneola sp.]|nr:MAG: hypothetical protein ED557_05655 [Balneola sp.]
MRKTLRVISQIDKYRYTDAWWQNSVSFDHSLSLSDSFSKKFESIIVECKIPNRKDSLINFEILIANLIYAKNRKPIRVSLGRSSNNWKKTRYTKAGKSTIQYIHILEIHGFIIMKKGFRDKRNPVNSRLTRITATNKLLSSLTELNSCVIKKPVELVELKDENGALIDYHDNSISNSIREILERTNRINSSSNILYLDQKLSVFLVSIFINDFKSYGRLHTRGYLHHQALNENERAEITIDGEDIGELDFSALHPNLLYALEGIQYFGDPYSRIDERPQLRPFLKAMLLALLNSEDIVQAERACNKWLFDNLTLDERQKLKLTKARPYLESMIEAHSPISHHFCSGKVSGLRIMNLDSKIALDILAHFTDKGIPILPVHDSFIVQRRYLTELKKVMKSVYRKHTNGYRIKVK